MKKEILPLLALLLYSCSDSDDILENENVASSLMSVSVAQCDDQTRGTLIESEQYMGSVGLYCAYTANALWSTETEFTKMYNRRYDYIDSQWCIYGDPETWDYESAYDKYTFFSYSPYESNGNGIVTQIDNGALLITYTVPSTCSYQPDLMIAEPLFNIEKPITGVVPLEFYHALASVRFMVIGDCDQTIKEISLSGVCDEGQLTWDTSYGKLKWSGLTYSEDSREFVPNINTSVEPDSDEATILTTNDGYLMMIPQEIDEGQAVATLTIDNNGSEITKEIPIPAATWEASEIYTYIINLEESEESTITQTSNCYILQPSNNKRMCYYIPVDSRSNLYWGDNGYSNAPDNVITTSRNNAVTGDNVEVLAAVLMYDCDNFDDFEVEIVTSGFSPKDILASNIPSLGGDFTDADCSVAMEITLGDVTEGNIVVAVYKDVDNSRDLKIDSNGAPLGGDEILWSWHLWITDYNPDAIALANQESIEANTIKEYLCDGVSGSLHRYVDEPDSSDSNLVEIDRYGDLWDYNGIYASKFIMDRNLGAIAADYKGQGNGSDYSCGVLYYQFGRKDPFAGEDAYYLGSNGRYSASNTPTNTSSYLTITQAVNYPTLFCRKGGAWCNFEVDTAGCLWNDPYVSSSYTDKSYGEKSLYDPSPLGWRLPVNGTWSNLEYNNSNQLFAWHSGYSCGYYGRIYPSYGNSVDHSVSFVYYPVSGHRYDSNARCMQGSNYGYSWSATSDSDNNGYCLYFTSSDVNPSSQRDAGLGLTVRAIQE